MFFWLQFCDFVCVAVPKLSEDACSVNSDRFTLYPQKQCIKLLLFIVFIEIFMIFGSIYLPAPKGVKYVLKYVLSGGEKLPFLSRNLSGLNTSGSGNTTGSRHPDRRLAVTLTPVKTKQSFIRKIERLTSFCLCVDPASKQGGQI